MPSTHGHPQDAPAPPRTPARRAGLSLSVKLPVLLGLLIAAMLAIDTVADYRSHMQAGLGQADARLHEVAAQLVQGYSRTLSELGQRVESTAHAPDVRAFLASASGREPTSRGSALQALRLLASGDQLLGAALLDPAGRVRLAATSPRLDHEPPLDSALLARARSSATALAGGFLSAAGNAAYPVLARVAPEGHLLGFVVLWREVSQSATAQRRMSGLIGNDGRIYIGNADDGVWTDFVGIVPRPLPSDALGAATRRDAVRARGPNGPVLAVARRVPTTPWSVVVAFSLSAVTAAAREALVTALLIDALVMLVGVGGAWVLGRRLTWRLVRLTRAAEAIAVPGAPPTPNDATAGDEIARLGIALDGMARRVTDALAARASTEEQYRGLFESVPLPLYVADVGTRRFLAVNTAMVDLYGYSRDEFMALTMHDIRPQDEVARLDADLRALNGHPQERGVWTHRTKTGALIDAEVVAHRCLFDGRHAVLALINDVTARNRAAAALRRSEEQNRTLIREAPYGIALTSLDGTLMEVNPALMRMLGHESAASLIGLPARDLYADPAVREALALRLEELGTVHGAEVTYKRRDGRPLTVRLNARRVAPGRGTDGYVETFIEDVSERRHLEMQFHEAQRMEAVGRLAGGIAHDFNNLLTVILATVELMLDGDGVAGPHAAELEDVYRSAKRGADLTRKLLAFSRRQVLTIRPMSVNAMVADTESLLQRLLGEDVQLRISLTSDHDIVRADPTQLEQVLFNLAANARDAMPRGGQLLIEVASHLAESTGQPTDEIMAPGAYVRIAVSDTGVGMPPEVREHAFEPFFTTKEREKGTGLGLATVYGIVKQLGGYVWIYSELDRGTTFKIYLPQEAAEVAPRTPEFARRETAAGCETVLIAEDEEAIRKLLTRVLEQRGYRVLAEPNGDAALERACAHDGHIDLLVTDVIMPGMSGPELAERVTSVHPGVVPLFLSGYTDEAVLRFGVAAGTVAFLQKPFTPNAFLTAVREALDKRARAAAP